MSHVLGIPGQRSHPGHRALRAGQADRGARARARHQRRHQARLQREPAGPVRPRDEGDAAALTALNRYPDGSGYYLRQALARRHGLTADHVILGNGSNDLIELMARAFLRPGEEAVIPHPSFVVYPMIVQAVGGIRVVVTLKDQRLDLEAMARAITPMTKMVFIANPNNPTATIVTADEVEHFMARVPDKVIVVFDEAYVEFAQGPDFPDTLAYLSRGEGRPRCAPSPRRRAWPGCGWATRWPIPTASRCSTASASPST